MKGPYRSRIRLAMDLLAAIENEGLAGVKRLLLVANLTHATLQELLVSFEEKGWILAERNEEQRQWLITEKGKRVLAEFRRVDSAMQDYGLRL
jgi:predicted transcriptional regulator